jgi:hypothetical protein
VVNPDNTVSIGTRGLAPFVLTMNASVVAGLEPPALQLAPDSLEGARWNRCRGASKRPRSPPWKSAMTRRSPRVREARSAGLALCR